MRVLRGPIRTFARSLRRLVLRLVGYWDIRAVGEENRAAIAELRQNIPEVVSKEIDRLDSYLVHHVEVLRNEIRGPSEPLPATIGAVRQAPPVLYVAEGLRALVRMGNGYDVVIPSDEAGLLTYFVHHGMDQIEAGVRAVIEARLRPGSVAFDVGASIGLHAVTMAAVVGDEGRVVCYEPLPSLADALEQTLRINGFAGHARVERVALSDAPGEVTFHIASHSPLSSIFSLPDHLVARSIPVPAVTLDDQVRPGDRVDLVKLDIEGAEPRAWRGMQRVLEDNHGIAVLMEWSASHFARAGESPDEFLRDIRAAGFLPFVIEETEPLGRLTLLGDGAAATLENSNLLLTRSFELAE